MRAQKSLLYKMNYHFNVNTPDAPVYYSFDYNIGDNDSPIEFQHVHQFYEVLILLDSSAVCLIDGKYYTIQPYDIVLLHPSRFHKAKYPENVFPKQLCINFKIPNRPDGFPGEFSNVLSIFRSDIPILRLSEKIQNGYIDTINEMYEISQQASPMRHLKIHALFIQFLCYLKEHSIHNIYTQQNNEDSIEARMHAVTRYIHNYYTEDLTLEQIAKEFFISPYYLSRCFKSIIGFTVIQYIQLVRVRAVRQYLLYTDMSITDIAQKTGFNSFSQFNRVFNKFCDISPSKFRANSYNEQALEGFIDSLVPAHAGGLMAYVEQ